MESSLKNRILTWSKGEPDVWLQKYHGTAFSLRGHPDVYGHVGGLALYLELKQPGKRLAPLQAAIGRKIMKSGAVFRRIDDFHAFLGVISELRLRAQPVNMR
jgi:hypothetical protein